MGVYVVQQIEKISCGSTNTVAFTNEEFRKVCYFPNSIKNLSTTVVYVLLNLTDFILTDELPPHVISG